MSASIRTALTVGSLAGVWWLLSGGDPGSWVIGLPSVIAAAWSSRRLGQANAGAFSLAGLLRFAPYFLYESLRGGVDVALRTLAPTMRIRPGFSHFRVRLKRPDARVFLVSCVGLLPGTLAAKLEGDSLKVHLIDEKVDASEELRRLERAIARIFPETFCSTDM